MEFQAEACLAPAGALKAEGEHRGEPVIELRGVGKRFGEIEALCDVSLRVAAGDIYGLLGPNGAGKSTVANIVCGLFRPDRGIVLFLGREVKKHLIETKRQLGVVPQDIALYPELSAVENLTFFGRLYGLGGSALRRRIASVLELVGLADRSKSPVANLSGGMSRRLNIAAAILHEPKAIVMDEPTVGLDPQNRANILQLVRTIANSGVAILYSTHYMDEVERLCTRIGILDRGRILTEGSLDDLRNRAGDKDRIILRGVFETEKLSGALRILSDCEIVSIDDHELVLQMDRSDRNITQVLQICGTAGNNIRDVEIRRQSLEALFIELTGNRLQE